MFGLYHWEELVGIDQCCLTLKAPVLSTSARASDAFTDMLLTGWVDWRATAWGRTRAREKQPAVLNENEATDTARSRPRTMQGGAGFRELLQMHEGSQGSLKTSRTLCPGTLCSSGCGRGSLDLARRVRHAKGFLLQF